MIPTSWPTRGTRSPVTTEGEPGWGAWDMVLPRSSTAVLERSRSALDQWSDRELPRDEHALANVVLVAAARHNAVVDEIEALLSLRLERRLTPSEEANYQLLAEVERALYRLHRDASDELARWRQRSAVGTAVRSGRRRGESR